MDWGKWVIIIAVVAYLLYAFAPSTFNNIKNSIPYVKDHVSDVQQNSTQADSTINKTVESLIDLNQPVTEGDKTFYGKPTFDCTNNVQCRTAFNNTAMTCELNTGRCYIQNG